MEISNCYCVGELFRVHGMANDFSAHNYGTDTIRYNELQKQLSYVAASHSTVVVVVAT